MYTTLIILSLVFFAVIAWYRYGLALGIFCALLPTYLIRFSVFGIPTTLLEGMLWIIVLISLFKNKKNFTVLLTKYNRSLIFATFLFLLGATISLFTSVDLRAALGEWKAFYVEPILLFFVLAITIKSEEKMIRTMIWGFLLGGLATAIFALYQHWSGGNFVPYDFWENRQTYRVTGWYGYPNAVGLYLGPLFALTLYGIKSQKNILYRIFCVLFLVTSLVACWYSKSTGALVGIAASIGLLLILYKKTRWPALILGLVGLVGIMFMPTENPLRQELLMQDRSGQLRIDMWGETVELLKARPFTGAGLASYSELIAPYRIDKKIEIFHHPHNIFMTMWVNIGLIGLIGFVWLVVWFFRVGFGVLKMNFTLPLPTRGENQRKEPSPCSVIPYLLASMTCVITMGLVDSPYIKNDLSIFFWLLIFFLIYILNNPISKKKLTKIDKFQ